MTAPDLVNLSALIDDAKCFALVRQHRWPEGVRCPACGSGSVVRDGFDETHQPHRQRYRCRACAGRFDDLTGTALAGHRQPLRMWVLCLCLMGGVLSPTLLSGSGVVGRSRGVGLKAAGARARAGVADPLA